MSFLPRWPLLRLRAPYSAQRCLQQQHRYRRVACRERSELRCLNCADRASAANFAAWSNQKTPAAASACKRCCPAGPCNAACARLCFIASALKRGACRRAGRQLRRTALGQTWSSAPLVALKRVFVGEICASACMAVNMRPLTHTSHSLGITQSLTQQ